MVAMHMNGTIINAMTNEAQQKAVRVAELKGILSSAIQSGESFVILKLNRKFFTIDTDIQTPERTERNLNYLVKNWDERKCLPLVGIPDFENGWVDIGDGWGRVCATAILDPEFKKYKYMNVMVILNAPTDPVERKKFEAELFVTQTDTIARLTPEQKHGARLVLGDAAAIAITKAKEKYGFEFYKHGGDRHNETNLISYVQMYRIAKKYGEEGLYWVCDLCAKAGFNRKSSGYSKYILSALHDIYGLYPAERGEVKEILADYMRDYNPKGIKANAMTCYPMLFETSAVSLFIEDIYTTLTHQKMKRKVNGTKVETA